MFLVTIGFIVFSTLVSYFLTKLLSKVMVILRRVGVDVHKVEKPVVPESCGLSILCSSSALISIIPILEPSPNILREVGAFLLTTVFIGFIGLLDDFVVLDAKTKTTLTIIGVTPLVLLNAYVPRPIIPFLGVTRLTVIYMLLLPLAIAIPANAVNMMDVFNGVMPSTMVLVFSSLLVSSIIAYTYGFSSTFPIYASSILIGSLLGYLYYNKYPSKVFGGDVGSLYVGSAFSCIAVMGRVEFAAITAFIPFVMNAFHSLITIGGLREHREISVRPVVVKEDMLFAEKDSRSPVTLAHLILLGRPMSEPEVVSSFIILTGVSSILAILSSLLMFN